MSRPSTEWAEATRAALQSASVRWAAIPRPGPAERRKIVAKLLRDLTERLRALDVDEVHLEPLQALNVALFDLASDVRNPFFQITLSGRERTSAHKRRARLYAVALVKWLAEAGVPVRTAQEFVAREFSRAGHRAHGNKTISWNTVRKWGENAFQGGERENEANVVRYHLEKWRSSLSGEPSAEVQRRFVRKIAEGLREAH